MPRTALLRPSFCFHLFDAVQATVHVMRLRNPWQVEDAAAPEHLVLLRRFGRPTNLEPDERVALVLSGFAADTIVSLNGRRLGVGSPGATLRSDVTEQLDARNALTLAVPRAAVQLEQVLQVGGRAQVIGTLVNDVHIEVRHA